MRLTRRLALTAPLALTACSRGEPIVLPFREANDHLIAPVSVRGRQTLALIDNGAPVSSIDQAFAATAVLPRDAAGVGLQPLPMQIGGAQLRIHPFTEDMSEASIATDEPLGALIGMELFNAFTPELSFTRGELILHPRRRFPTPANARVFSTDQGPAPHPRLPIDVEGVEASAFIDLGCSAALAISPALAERIGLMDGRQASTRQVILSDANGLGLGVSRLTSLKTVAFAGHTFHDVPIDILPGDAKAFAGLDAVVGVPLLRKFDIALDLPRRISMAPNARLNAPFDRRMTGLQTRPEGSGLLIRHVAAHSPAEAAGFKPGDQILAINGSPPKMRTIRNVTKGQMLTFFLANDVSRTLTGARYY